MSVYNVYTMCTCISTTGEAKRANRIALIRFFFFFRPNHISIFVWLIFVNLILESSSHIWMTLISRMRSTQTNTHTHTYKCDNNCSLIQAHHSICLWNLYHHQRDHCWTRDFILMSAIGRAMLRRLAAEQVPAIGCLARMLWRIQMHRRGFFWALHIGIRQIQHAATIFKEMKAKSFVCISQGLYNAIHKHKHTHTKYYI